MPPMLSRDEWIAGRTIRAAQIIHDLFVEAAPRAASFSIALHCRDPRREVTKKGVAACFDTLETYAAGYTSRAVPMPIADPGQHPASHEAQELLYSAIQEYAWDRGMFDTPVDPAGRAMISVSFLRGVDLTLANNVRARLKTGDEADPWLLATHDERNRLNHIGTWNPTNPTYARIPGTPL